MVQLIGLIMIIFLSGCGDGLQVSPLHRAASSSPLVPDDGNSGTDIEEETPPAEDNTNIPLCSDLSFKGVSFPKDFREADRDALSLALNISGSFEGHSGWTNLTNNFDGQGISMGLLNQNLGQGTLQPLFIDLRDNHFSVLQKSMSAAMLNSLLAMLSTWEKNKSLKVFEEESEPLREKIPSILNMTEEIDKFYAVPMGEITLKLASHNQKSVNWSVTNVYSDSAGKKFKSNWKSALAKIAGDPTYVSLQVKASRHLHDRAHKYKERLGLREVRTYLFLFDIAVQNGSLKEKHFTQFFNWFSSNPKASEEKQMLKMLEIRVVDVNSRWRNDVRARKKSIILGKGFVHGASRDMQKEYCFDQTFPYDQGATPIGGGS